MRYSWLILPAFLATTLHAAPPPGEKPRETKEMIGDTVTQPLADANLKRREIPQELLDIKDDPYALAGIKTCRQLIAEVEKMNAVLGKDFDQIALETRGDKRRNTVIGTAGSVLTGFIPFRGVIREVSGANRADDQFRDAVYAGVVRRGFLKGVGLTRRCRPPGRPFTDLEGAQKAAAEIMDK